MTITPIATIHTEFPEKFGIPRQSGLAASLRGRVVFEPAFRNPDALRGLEDFSHIWLIWEFSANVRRNAASDVTASLWQPTVRPPRLGGNKAMGVFATRSPFRPNPLGLSCVEVESIEFSEEYGPVINVNGADLMDGTPIFDIKPYLSFTDSHPEAKNGFADKVFEKSLDVIFTPDTEKLLTQKQKDELSSLLSQDPRPSYQNDEERTYGMDYSNFNVSFRVCGNTLTVISVTEK